MASKESSPFFLSKHDFEPAYLALHRQGELQLRAERAIEILADCRICPRACGVNRLADETGVCNTGRLAQTSSHFPHRGEEDPISGWRGSGTIFFGQCNLRCVFCQNYDISQQFLSQETTPICLAEMMLELQESGCHNINFVTPSHVVPQILEALILAVEAGLRLPLVYNTSAYDALETLQLLDGVIDIYMPDLKIWEDDLAAEYLTANDYPSIARQALREMHRQVGPLKLDERGLAKRGVLLRHLVMPAGIAGTDHVMEFICNEISADTYVNLMTQYRPESRVTSKQFPQINHRPTASEYRAAFQSAEAAGIWRFDDRKTGFWIVEF